MTRRSVTRNGIDPVVRNRRLKVEELIDRGVTSLYQMSRLLNVAYTTIITDVEWIQQEWAVNDPKEVQTKRLKRIRQLEGILRLSLDAFDRSTEDETEESISIRQDDCKRCEGQGIVQNQETEENEWCDFCEGTGLVELRQITRRRKGKAGDAALLNVAKATIGEINKLEGTVRISKDGDARTTNIINAYINNPNRPYEGLPNSTIIEARSLVRKIEEAKKHNGQKDKDT